MNRSKIYLLSDSLISSGLNFLLTFFILKINGSESLVCFGLAMTYSLIALSIQRAIILIPFNLQETQNIFSITILEYFSSSYFLLIITSFILFAFSIFLYDLDFFILVASMYCYLFQHELLKYYLIFVGKIKVICITPMFKLIIILSLLIFNLFDLMYIAYVYFTLIFIEFIIVVLFIYPFINGNKDGIRYLSWFSNWKILLHRNLFSLSQLSMVHLPFIIISYFSASSIASILFISRAVFQPVQIVIKTFEAIDQRKLADINVSAMIIRTLFFKYFYLSILLSIVCFSIANLLLYRFYDVSVFPGKHDFFIWGGIFILMSVNKVSEMFFYKFNAYSFIIQAYLCGFIFFLTLTYFFFYDFINSSVNYSILIFLSWLIVVAVSFFKIKSIKLDSHDEV